MKHPGSSRYLLRLMLILTTGLATSTDTSSFWKRKAVIYSIKHIGQLPYTEIPALSEFTACLDIFRDNNAPLTALSYCVQDRETPELGFGWRNNKLEVFHLGIVHEVKTDLKQNVWHTVCITWKSLTKQLEVYVNETRVYNTTTEDKLLKANGSLVLGARHTRKGGQIALIVDSFMTGEIYNYQMWNYTRSQEDLLDCIEGNILSWTKEPWMFIRTAEDVQLRCANAAVTTKPSASTTTPTTTLANATVTLTPTASTTTPTTTLAVTTKPSASTTTPTTTLANATVTLTPTASTTTPTTTLANATVTLTPTASTTTPTTTLANAAITTKPSASITTPTTTLGTTTSTSTRTPAPENSAPTEILPVATGSLTSITTTSEIVTTSVDQKETASSNSNNHSTSSQLQDTLSTRPPMESHLSTKASTETLPGNEIQTNSSVKLPTGNTESTTDKMSSTYGRTPGQSTTSDVPISSWKDNTTIQQQSTNTNRTLDPQVVSTGTLTSSTQPDITSEPMKETTPQVVITPPTTKSITPSTVTNGSDAFQSSSSSTYKSSIETYSLPSTVVTTAPHTTLHGLTESPASHSGTTYIAFTSTEKTLSPNTVTFYILQITFTIPSTDVIDEDMVTSLLQSMLNEHLNNTEFAAVQMIVFDTVNNEPGNVPTQLSNKKKRKNNENSGESNPTEYIAKSIVRANSSGNPELLADQLQNLLMKNFTDPQLNLSLIAQNVATKPLVAEPCRNDSTSYDDFSYKWPETNPTEKATLQCHLNSNELATRDCYINVTTLKTEWGDPNYSKCPPSSFEDLENIIVTPENANSLAMQMLNMTKKATSLPENDIRIILNKVSEIISLGEIDLQNAKVHVDVINFILIKADTSLRLFTNKILNLMNEVGFKMNFLSDVANVTADFMALLVSKKFEEMSFSVTTYLEGKLEITLEQFPTEKAVAFIHLPKSIQEKVEISSSKIQFNFIGSTSPFKDYESSDYVLNTYVISASFEGTNIENLMEPIDITLQHLKENVEDYPVKCVFWDFNINDNMGGWNTSGCEVTFTNGEYTSCSCSHLTHFGVLLDISRRPINPQDDYILSLFTYVGCGIASLFLGLALVTYGIFKQLRRDYPSKILINLSFSLLMLNLLFLVNNWLSSFRSQGLCISTAALLHYFLLTTFTWMGLEAVHMYFAFVKVFNSYVHKYILKLCIAGWGIPIIVVVTVLSVNVNFYGDLSDNKQYDVPGDSNSFFCWIQNDIVFYVAVVSYFCVIFLSNISIFIVVLLQIKSLKSTRKKDWKAIFMHDIKSTLSLAFLLGLTWGFVFFAWGPVRIAFLYLFTIFNTLHGFFIFVFHCLIKENVRRHWRMYLCCGRCRLDNYSDWSRLSNVDTKYNGRIHLSPSDSYQSTRSNNTASTSNASSLSSFSTDPFCGRSYVNGGGIFISSAHTVPSYHATVYPDNRRILTFLD